MASKRKAEESLAGPSKRRGIEGGAGACARGVPDEELSAAFKAVAGALVPALTELAARTAEVRGSETLVENGETPQLAGDLDREKLDGEGAKERLEQEKALRLQEAGRYIAARRDLAEKERAQEELLIHSKLDVMQLVRTQFREPDETDEEVRLCAWPNNREAMIAGSGRGRFFVEAAAMWNDWCARRDGVGEEARGNVLPRSYPEVKAVQVANEKERARAVEAQQAAEAAAKTAETERLLEAAETRRRRPPIPAHAPGQHPESRRRNAQPKWSKRAPGAPATEALPFWVGLGLARPKKPAGKGKGKKRRNR